MSNAFALAIGVGTKNSKGEWLEVFYSKPLLNPADSLIEAAKSALGYEGGNQAIEADGGDLSAFADALAELDATQSGLARACIESEQPVVITVLATDAQSSSTPEVYLKLHLLSHRLVKPHGVNLAGMFGLLPNVAWTNQGAIDLAELPAAQLDARLNGTLLSVNSVDKFPRMTDYVVPAGVRIADTSRVRLGAYVGEGTTIMHEGFVNFNAGTEGVSMVEGRISAGVVVGNGSDLGGGCSTMGTLSGGGNIIISVGENCLLGANAGIGIPLGDRCTVEAGLYVTAGTKILVLDDQKNVVETVKGRDLAGKSDLLFRRDSISGAVQCVTNKSAIQLNEELHAHN
ncbi:MULTISPECIES: 2,3,4,5-tetrahydropyridine-2,6-dicarboxylate N-succinyltransferase [unclassified Oceanobacter]|uniref:2,3,4,5-tetrahydropyridine-2,6-dicarboxylate N-succinyltransferase n=1 Tax=unclassified Oceanobacter TaxID=2620260 RepID=UPI0026E296DA|nr:MULTISPECIES: 2,3,4,5-tetrahydropyridine-2,6-dicarboxylate N-succinyltransferase [unclassified Oceanobacter]MDO6682180.1 2,3,4,5-tetrahydropyridine-2,6-dicarboxylate N-succinyltransferase [Oceanobacter sp. 5_MG-2023]MDP2546357.1 2,3,4,5-tetrahydropyridine-2,6-dicarboxylate N-succinyltransferase [Oceanobacter sp. 4_MG-2023]MDP2610556.1 2,3,4,5-tetrahydropyridine-2,6-dicarboxylate N-succinyltransferase [Oceanobacter sp. 1_MG-2023]MDP2613835.1 2,3,4,5-tetrahydropyridine-2,6-dicarboxylate N-succ